MESTVRSVVSSVAYSTDATSTKRHGLDGIMDEHLPSLVAA